jgi:predicted N-acetyltransferase YhbS
MGADTVANDVTIRAAREADEPGILALLHTAMGWSTADPNRELFRWKHHDNPAGASAAWVADAGGEIVGFRPFLRWRFRHDGADIDAVRAVDAATHPAFQRRGIFSALTQRALDALTDEGVAFVFNTPNNSSRPGELKLGWRQVGRLPVSVQVAGAPAAMRMLRARVAADRWSLPTEAGEPALDVLVPDILAPEMLLGMARGSAGLATARTLEHLRWRYGFAPLHYRALRRKDGSVAVFRVRRRGGAREATVCELFTRSHRAAERLVHDVVRAAGADYAISLGTARAGVPLPGQGPLLVHRPLGTADAVPTRAWQLALGDIELF